MAEPADGPLSGGVKAPSRARIGWRTLRKDRYWLEPTLIVAGLSAWLLYGFVRVFMQDFYYVAEHHYLTPFYSPCTSTGCVEAAAHFGRFTPDHPLIPFAALSLPFLLLLRLTCYYYRKAYYRSFWMSPPACAVPDRHASYTGETRFPLILQNLHRYTFYIAVVIVLINTWDAILAFGGEDGFGVGLGNLVLLFNVVMLWLYTLSCHSCRHVFGGRLRHFSRHPVRYRWWTFVSKLNTRHMQYAWMSLGSLFLVDFYVMAVAAGWISDLRFF
ncbi:hypothetical protein EF847_18130 [Actinobacteria bacterium YIM 96077]|uniref:Succinate dehydrogenase n=1 Tax=Phytoactinopolyspora halophila TaxID=1981511 RepID=A0A329QS29_9ACTN|nr:hypothetical protein [Phytoactinopolyspora halophila]AYY15638.1 hypothetical protein EF847_18130 [Actinobacteria bacterium YIM 96077]RAW14906.1 hypothetical protein DPM12_10345 [Phytoactinopolyspora halophila]